MRQLTVFAFPEFRNTQEIERFLDKMGKSLKEDIKKRKEYEAMFASVSSIRRLKALSKLDVLAVKTFNVQDTNKPDSKMPGKSDKQIKKLAKDFQLINDLVNKLKTLDMIEIRTKETFAKDKRINQVLKSIVEKRKEVQDELIEAKKMVTMVANKKIPNKYKLENQYIAKRFLKAVKGDYEKAQGSLFVNSHKVEDGVELQFTYILELWEFKTKSGYVYPVFYVVINHIMDARGEVKSYVSTQTHFISPYSKEGQHLSVGSQYKTKNDALHILSTEMEMEGFVGLFDTDAVPFDLQQLGPNLFRSQKFIKNIKVQDTEKGEVLTFVLTPESKTHIEEIRKSLMADLRGLLIEDKEKNTFRSQVIKSGKFPTITFQFIVPPSKGMKSVRLSQQFVEQMQHQFGLTDEQAKIIVRFLRGGK